MRLISLFPVLVFAPLFAIADTGGGGQSGPVLEVVQFRLIAGTSDSAFVAAAEATQAPVRRQPGFIARNMVRDETGLWTDLVTWRDLAAAQAGAAAMMTDPAFGPFMALIDGQTVQISYPHIMMRMD